MIIGILKEIKEKEKRVAITPTGVAAFGLCATPLEEVIGG